MSGSYADSDNQGSKVISDSAEVQPKKFLRISQGSWCFCFLHKPMLQIFLFFILQMAKSHQKEDLVSKFDEVDSQPGTGVLKQGGVELT